MADLCDISFDRYRRELKGTWKDQPLPASGQTYDLGAHLIDQTLALFGRPHKITGFIQNIRGNGNINVDDTVSPLVGIFVHSCLKCISFLFIYTMLPARHRLYH